MQIKTCSALCGFILTSFSLHAQHAQVVRAPILNGKVEGSVQQMTAEAVTFNSGGTITGDLFIPGVPVLQLNGAVDFGGTTTGAGNALLTGHRVTLNSGARLGGLRTRSDALSLPLVPTPPSPSGTRSVSLNTSSQSPGNFGTLRNLTLNSNVGTIAVPPGDYGDFTANSGSSFMLGLAGTTTPALYTFRQLTINSNSQLHVIGPVIVTVINTVTLNSSGGASARPDWMKLQISAGGLTLNSGVSFYGSVLAPNGSVIVNSNSQLVGGLVAQRLTLNSNSLLRLTTANQAPAVLLQHPSTGTNYSAPANFTLTADAADPDGNIAKVEFFEGTLKLGEAAFPPYQFSVRELPGGAYAFKARATDNDGASAESTILAITITTPNLDPKITLTTPANGARLMAPASLTLSATASDADGSVSRVEFYQDAIKLGQLYSPPYELEVRTLPAGTYEFKARVVDNLGATTTSIPATIAVEQANLPPMISVNAPADGTIFTAPASFLLVAEASDPDGTLAKVEFFRESVRLGESSVPPYHFNQFSITDAAFGSYLFTARATDDSGGVATSAPVRITVNERPNINLIFPLHGTRYDLNPTVVVQASAADADGTISRVEFYQGSTKLGESTSAPYQFTWTDVPPGEYELTARAHDNHGAALTSAAHSISVQATLPFFTSFELTENYTLGVIASQWAWQSSGSAEVRDNIAFNGAHSLVLPPDNAPAVATHTFHAHTDRDVVFIDFFGKPAAASGYVTPLFKDDVAQFAVVQVGFDEAELYAFNGGGTAGREWQPTGTKFAVAPGGYTVDWLRFTLREDFSKNRWDLYLNGSSIAVNLGFANEQHTSFSRFTLTGQLTAPTSIDDIFVGFENPLFVDYDKDGMNDLWEIEHALNPTLDDRDQDLDQDGLTNIQELQIGTDPNAADGDGDGIPDLVELAFGYDPKNPQTGISLESDLDGDGLTFAQELRLHTDPLKYDDLGNTDTDGDGLLDVWEIRHGSDPESAETLETMNSDADGDGLSLNQEALAGTNPNLADSDDDGMRDDYEKYHGLDPLVADGGFDADLDGLTNLQEFRRGSDPTDYYNGAEPEILPFIGGNGSLGAGNLLAVRVTDKLGNPLINAPVIFEQDEGTALLALTPDGPSVGRRAEVRTGPGGIARVYLANP